MADPVPRHASGEFTVETTETRLVRIEMTLAALQDPFKEDHARLRKIEEMLSGVVANLSTALGAQSTSASDNKRIDDRVTALEMWRAGTTGQVAGITLTASVVASGAALLLSHLWK